MVLSMLLALTTCPAMLGTQEAIRQSQSKERREEHRARRCNLIATCVKPSIRSREINGRQVILRDNKLYIDTGNALQDNPDEQPTSLAERERLYGHPFAGYFLPYPDSEHEGLVSTITDIAPILNWIYVDKDTYELRYGVRADAQPHVTGPFDCTRLDRRLTLEDWEGFVAVEETPAIWALYFDRDDNGLKGKIPFGTRVLEIELSRREKKVTVDVKRETMKEQELFRQEMEQRRQQEEMQQHVNTGPEPEQQMPEEGTHVESQAPQASADVPVARQDFAEIEHALHEHEEQHREHHQHHGADGEHSSPCDVCFVDLAAGDDAEPSPRADSPVLPEHAEETVSTPTDTNCGASVWSAHESSKFSRDNAAISHATPDSSVTGDDEIATTEAAFRHNSMIGAPSPSVTQKFRNPYVEDE